VVVVVVPVLVVLGRGVVLATVIVEVSVVVRELGVRNTASIAISLDQLLPVVPTNRTLVASAGTCTVASCHSWP